MAKIQEVAQALIDKHRSVRKAAEVCGISYSLLWKLAKGKQVNPTVGTLMKLGLKIRRDYVRKEGGS